MAADSAVTLTAPDTRFAFQIALICSLPIEYDAACLAIDEFWDDIGDRYGQVPGDENHYSPGRIGRHHAVVALLINGPSGIDKAIEYVRLSYTGLRLAFIVGVCGGAPNLNGNDAEEVLLGDVIISRTILQHNQGSTPNTYTPKPTINEDATKSDPSLRSLLAVLQSERGMENLTENTAAILKQIQEKARSKKRRKNTYEYPGTDKDLLYHPGHRHKHDGGSSCQECNSNSGSICGSAVRATCQELGCDDNRLVLRDSLREKEEYSLKTIQDPSIYLGAIASVMEAIRSGEERDEIVAKEDVVAFEDHNAGSWEDVPAVVIKGVSNYADGHRTSSHDQWEAFSAATSVAAAKALLSKYIHVQVDSPPAPVDTEAPAASAGVNPFDYMDEEGDINVDIDDDMETLINGFEESSDRQASPPPPASSASFASDEPPTSVRKRRSKSEKHRDHRKSHRHKLDAPSTRATSSSGGHLVIKLPGGARYQVPVEGDRLIINPSVRVGRKRRPLMQEVVMFAFDAVKMVVFGVQMAVLTTVTLVGGLLLGLMGMLRVR